jgi:hypothetical protein
MILNFGPKYEPRNKIIWFLIVKAISNYTTTKTKLIFLLNILLALEFTEDCLYHDHKSVKLLLGLARFHLFFEEEMLR